MLIRVEIPIDAPGIDALLRRSFESDAEAKLVHDLREDGFLTLGRWMGAFSDCSGALPTMTRSASSASI